MTGLVDYGAGNMKSVANALDRLGATFEVCETPEELRRVRRIVLPGVGHFSSAARRLTETGMLGELRDQVRAGTPLLGICLGLQLLFEGSDEAPGQPGLDLLPGRTVRLEARRVPHMGWNRVIAERSCALLPAAGGEYFYFAHGYVTRLGSPEHLLGSVAIDDRSHPAVVGREGLWGVQFHPEKSGEAGLALLRRFTGC